jgi:hypothetical protein
VSEVEPKSYQPDDVENYEHRVSEGVLDVSEAVCWAVTKLVPKSSANIMLYQKLKR